MSVWCEKFSKAKADYNMFVPTQLAVQACGDISKQTLSLSYHRQAANFRSTALVLFIKENNIKPTMILYAVLYPFTPSVVSYARAQIGLHSLIPLTGEFQINKHKYLILKMTYHYI